MAENTFSVVCIDALLQLVMQCCDQASRFALARCNRATFRAASHAVAWKFLPPVRVDLRCFEMDLDAHVATTIPPRRSLGRFTTTHIIAEFWKTINYDTIRMQMECLPPIRRVSFNVEIIPKKDLDSEIERCPWSAVFARYAHTMSGVCWMELGDSFAQNFRTRIHFPPALETLILHGSFDAIELEGLSSLPRLTTLDLSQISWLSDGILIEVAQCAHLYRLEIGSAGFNVLSSIRSGKMSNLRELVLHSFSCMNYNALDDEVQTKRGIFSLPNLHTLEFLHSGSIPAWVGSLVRSLPADTSLRTIVFEPDITHVFGLHLPSEHAVELLRDRCPSPLNIVFSIPRLFYDADQDVFIQWRGRRPSDRLIRSVIVSRMEDLVKRLTVQAAALSCDPTTGAAP